MANEKNIIQLPKSIPPHSKFGENALWIEMTPFEVDYQTVYSAKGGGIKRTGKTGPTFKFLAPSSIQENIAHAWEDYESVMTRLAGKIKDFAKLKAEASGLQNIDFTKMATDTISNVSKGGLSNIAGTAQNQLSNMLGAGGGTNIPKVKVDSPLVYSNSGRREYSLTFQLASEDKNNPGKDIFDPIRELEKYSCPDIKNNSLTAIKLPWVFKVKSYPGNLIKINHAALESVQPTYQEPYMKGYPMRAELTLNFKDMSPLYKRTLEEGGVIKVL